MRNYYNNTLISKLSAALLSTLLILAIIISNTESLYAYTKIGEGNNKEPDIIAESAILYSNDLDKVVYSKNADTRCNPYSITKLVTAWIVCDRLDMDKIVTISNNAANPPANSTTIYLKEGEQITIESLLYGMLLESGNDAAIALGEAVSGSEEKFAKLMTETVRSWGCENTSFANASGMKDDNHYTTASDFLIIAQKAFSVDKIREITEQKEATIPATNLTGARTLENKTPFITEEESGVVRGKTGTWSEDDCSVCLQYYKNELSATLILLQDTKDGRKSDTKALLKYAHKITPGYRVASKKESVGKLWIKGGKRTRITVYVDEAVYAYPKDGKERRISVKLIKDDNVVAPIKKGTVVGKYEVYVDKKLVATRNLIVKEDIEKGFFTANAYISNRVALAILIVILAYVILLIVAARNRCKRRARRAAERAARRAKYN